MWIALKGKLGKGKKTLIDDSDFELVNKYKWYLSSSGYAVTYRKLKSGWRPININYLIMGEPKGFDTDHINHNKLDNRRKNLRICSHSENMRNMKLRSRGTSKFTGVCWCKSKKLWMAYIGYKNKDYNLGYFENELDAVKIRDLKAKELFKEYANLNFERVNL